MLNWSKQVAGRGSDQASHSEAISILADSPVDHKNQLQLLCQMPADDNAGDDDSRNRIGQSSWPGTFYISLTNKQSNQYY